MRTPRRSALQLALLGAAADAAGTTALNTATYLDMAVQGRPSTTAPPRPLAISGTLIT